MQRVGTSSMKRRSSSAVQRVGTASALQRVGTSSMSRKASMTRTSSRAGTDFGGTLSKKPTLTRQATLANNAAGKAGQGARRGKGDDAGINFADGEEPEENVESQASIEEDRNLSMWDAAPWREKLFAVAEPGSFPSDIPQLIEIISYIYATIMVSIIVLSCVAIMTASDPKYQTEPVPIFWLAVEAICVAAFSVDIVLRLVTIPNRRDFFTDPMNMIDIVAVMPFYILLFVSAEEIEWLIWLRMLRILRLARIIRVLRTANVLGFTAILDATSKSVSEMLLFIIISGTCLLILSTAFFFAERGTFDRENNVWMRRCFKYEVCSTEPSPVQSIPDAFWYIITTLATVGFGDVYPKTGVGQLVGAATMITGVFIMGFPTMILSGHYEAGEKLEIKMFSSWAHLKELKKKKEKPGDTLKRKMGWVAESINKRRTSTEIKEEELLQKMGIGKPKTKGNTHNKDDPLGLDVTSPKDDPLGATASKGGTDSLNTSMSGSQSTMRRGRGTDKSKAAFTTVGLFAWGGQTHELKKNLNIAHQYTYDPMFAIQRNMEGAPDLRVIWGRAGMPTMVQMTLILDHADTRQAAIRVLNDVDPEGHLKCSPGGGFEIFHFTPNGRAGKYRMMPAVAKDNYRNSDFNIYFMRDEDGDGEADAVDYLTEELAIAECMASLMGTSFFIKFRLPEATRRRRVTVVQQMIQNTRLERELKMIALQSDDELDHYAYVTHSDAQLLLQGVSGKIDLEDPALALEDGRRVDWNITNAVLTRMRTVKVGAIPLRLRAAIYNRDLIKDNHTLYEVPMSIFHSDLLDEVEIDSLGYVEVRVSPYLSRGIRVDFRMDGAGLGQMGGIGLTDW